MGKDEKSKPKKVRLIMHLGRFLVSHCVLVSILCCSAGYATLLLLPILAKNTYISENALMPGSADPMFSVQDTELANRLVKDIVDNRSVAKNRLEIIRLIADNMAAVGAEVYFHKTYAQNHQFHPLHFFSDPEKIHPETMAAALHPRGDGKESIVLVTPYNSDEIELSEATTLGLAFSIFSLLSRVTWLAKDIIWLAADTRHGEYNSVSTWLRDYHNPIFFNTGACAEKDFSSFRRAGTMAAALVLRVKDKEDGSEMDSLTIRAEASNGQMPNLDLINIVHLLAVHRQALHVKIGTFSSLHGSTFLKAVRWELQSQWAFGVPASDYVKGTATLASSIYSQALGVPTGSHGAFRDYQIDAIALEVLIEGVIRSVNNLLEKFHQSFFLYLLTSPNRFVSVGVYMIAFALLVAPFPIAAAALFSEDQETHPADSTHLTATKDHRWRWLHAARAVFLVHLWAAIVSLLPYLIYLLPILTSDRRALTWVSLSIFSLITLKHLWGSNHTPPSGWVSLKAVMISAAAVGLSLMSIINFSTAQIGAVLLVPLCLMVRPLRQSRALLLSACNVLLTVISFPPAASLVTKILLDGSGEFGIGSFWDWMEALWAWNSATYLYLLLVHLPCWVLCVHILLHP
ncbi:unnamed protein product [Spirodela intermedia]|uniref:Uncharacterized protein n=1 Tax=Spirodela intermedia TaxID=51605 RepID=A0A7I8IVX9_SPIIN|nr:unnamed protein product [Spirodela intermedia]CAA6661969.1 unnamed protein product [Spirodela intermedia]